MRLLCLPLGLMCISIERGSFLRGQGDKNGDPALGSWPYSHPTESPCQGNGVRTPLGRVAYPNSDTPVMPLSGSKVPNGSTSELGAGRNLEREDRLPDPDRNLPPIFVPFRGHGHLPSWQQKAVPVEDNRSITNGVGTSCVPLGLTARRKRQS